MTNDSLFLGVRVLALAGVLSGCGARSAIEQIEERAERSACRS